MSECSNNLHIEGKPVPRTCERCGLGPCHVWRSESVPVGDGPDEDPEERIETPAAAREALPTGPEPIVVEARAKAFDFAMRLAAQSDRAADVKFPELISIADRIVLYLIHGK